MPVRLAAASLILVSSAAASLAQAPVRLAQHRVVYDLSLVRSGGSRAVESARGRIAFDFTGDACEGYALKYRQVTVLESGETGPRRSDLRTTTFEAPDGRSFRFKTETESERIASEVLDGTAERGANGTTAVRLRQPKAEAFALEGDPVFPTGHMLRLLEAARAGETTLTLKVYDGSDDGRKLYDTLAVIGQRIQPGQGDVPEAGLKEGPMAGLARWPVTLSYYKQDRAESTPIYILSFELYENGVSRRLKLDYGDFALAGDVATFELLPDTACRR